jgi:integrase
MANPYLVKEVCFPSGERMPLLVRRSSGVAIEAPSYWITSERRPLGFQANTLQRELRDLMMLYLWADTRGFDPLDRLRSPAFLRLSELNDLDRFCRKRVGEAVAEASSRVVNGIVVPFPVRGKQRGRTEQPEPAGRLQVRNRMATIHSFMDHVSSDHLSRLTPGTDAHRTYAASRKEMLDKWIERYSSLDIPNNPDPGVGLDKASLSRLKDVIRPDHPDNRWAPNVRNRNGLMVLLLWSLGVRRGELCALQTSDLKLSADRAFLSIVRRPNNAADKRKSKPGVKTLGRELLLDPQLAKMLHAYILVERREHPGARKHPFVFVSSVDGAPLTMSSVNKFFAVLRKVSGPTLDLSPHVLRHSWNDAFSEASNRASPHRNDVEKHKEERMRTYMMGWSANSKMAALYSARWIKEAANRRSLELQKDIAHVEDVPSEPEE